MARGEQACRAVEEKLPPRRDGLPPETAAGIASLGLRFAPDVVPADLRQSPTIKKQGCLAPLAGQIDNVVS